MGRIDLYQIPRGRSPAGTRPDLPSSGGSIKSRAMHSRERDYRANYRVGESGSEDKAQKPSPQRKERHDGFRDVSATLEV